LLGNIFQQLRAIGGDLSRDPMTDCAAGKAAHNDEK
jgi:hypothetical protein